MFEFDLRQYKPYGQVAYPAGAGVVPQIEDGEAAAALKLNSENIGEAPEIVKENYVERSTFTYKTTTEDWE